VKPFKLTKLMTVFAKSAERGRFAIAKFDEVWANVLKLPLSTSQIMGIIRNVELVDN